MSPQIPVRLIRQVRQRAGDVCEYCRLPQASQEATFHVDHVLRRSQHRPTELLNLALACVTCSLRKSARTSAVDPKTGNTAVSVQQHHLVFRSTSAFRQWLSSALCVSSFFTSALFAVGAVSTFILAVGADVVRMVGGPDVGAEGMVVH